jgi:group II intron maturase
MQRIRERSRTEMRALRGTNAAAVLQRLNPIIRGWAAYYRTVVSKHAFTTLDAYVWWLAFKVGRPQPPEQADDGGGLQRYCGATCVRAVPRTMAMLIARSHNMNTAPIVAVVPQPFAA